jgi:hypothetical protein
MAEELDDMAADIRAAIEATSGDPAPVIEARAPEPVEEPQEAPEQPQAEDGQPRGPDGKFAPKDKAPEAEKPVEQPEAKAEPEQAEEQPKPGKPEKAPTPPIGWSPQAKAKFAELPDEVKADIAKREREINTVLQEKAERYKPLEQVIGPYRDKWAMRGVDDATAVKQLLAASDWLERDPKSALAYLAQQYNIPLTQDAPQPQQAQPGAVASQSPELVAVQRQLQELQSHILTERQTEVVSQVQAFAENPENLYFENVREMMGTLIRSGQAKDLQQAYDMACYANPEIRSLILADQRVKEVKTQQQAEAERAQKAKQAGASVTGAPGNTIPKTVNGSGSVEDDIRASIAELAGNA